MPIRHGTTRSRKKLIQPSNSTRTGTSSRATCSSCHFGISTSAASRNQKKPCAGSVRRYGSSPIGGKAVRPAISTGTRPRKRRRSSSTGCAERARFATHRIASPSSSRR